MKKILLVLAFLGCSSGALADEAADDEWNCDDDPSCVLQVKAWDALAAGKNEVAVNFAAACFDINVEQGLIQQASLSAKPADGGYPDNAALNNAGTCLFIKGEALTKLNKKDEAAAAFNMVVDELSYSQAWDPKGWFWTVADAAKQSLAKL